MKTIAFNENAAKSPPSGRGSPLRRIVLGRVRLANVFLLRKVSVAFRSAKAAFDPRYFRGAQGDTQ
jgi:hypothetical protein